MLLTLKVEIIVRINVCLAKTFQLYVEAMEFKPYPDKLIGMKFRCLKCQEFSLNCDAFDLKVHVSVFFCFFFKDC